MTGNPLRAGLAEGRVLLGTWINLVHNPAILSLLKAAGLDYVRVDMEHSSPSIETVAQLATVSRALDLPLLARPPSASREWITRLLDAGVWGLHIPQVDTADIARAVVDAARYAPEGRRGIAGLSAGNDFTSHPDLAALNREVHITVMLESALAFENLDEIVGTAGIDAVTLGPNDLAQDLGLLGRPEAKAAIDEHRSAMLDAARRHGKDVAMLCDGVDEARRWAEAGARILVLSSDVAVLHHAYSSMAERLRAALS